MLYGVRTHIKEFKHLCSQLRICVAAFVCAKSIYIEIHWACHTYGVCHLDKNLITNTCNHHVLCYVSCSIRGATVNLGWVFARESATTVSASASVCVNNNLTSRKTRVTMRTSYYKLASRVYIEFEVPFVQLRISAVKSKNTGQKNISYIFFYLGKHSFIISHELIMLSRYHYSLNTQRFTTLTVLNGHLAFGIGAEVRHKRAFSPESIKLLKYRVRHIKRHWHVVIGLRASITKHNTLVTSTLLHRVFSAYSTVNISTLLMNSGEHTAAFSLKLIGAIVIAYTAYNLTCHALNIYIGISCHLTRKHHLTSSHKGFTCHMR